MSNYDGRVTVADILRREGITRELPVVADDVDDAPTDLIPVAELLRRESVEDRARVDFYDHQEIGEDFSEDRSEDEDRFEEDSFDGEDRAENPSETRFEERAEDRYETRFLDGGPDDHFEARVERRPEDPTGKTDRRWVGKAGAVAAGIAALAGLAVTVLGTGQVQDAAAPIPGGSGGPAIDPPTTSLSDSVSPGLKPLTDTSPQAPSSTVSEGGSAATSGARPGSAMTRRDSQPTAPSTSTAAPAPASSKGKGEEKSTTTTTTSSLPSSAGTTTTTNTPPGKADSTSSSPAASDPLTTLTSPITGTLGSLVGGLLGG